MVRLVRLGAMALVVFVVGPGTSAVGSGPASAEAGAMRHAAIHHDVSGPLRTVSRGEDRLPPTGRKEADGGGDGDGEGIPSIPRGATTLSDPIVQRSVSAPSAPSPDASFNGMGNLEGYIPPDPNGAAGPTAYLQAVNDSIAEYSKTGTRLFGPVEVASLWNGFGGRCENWSQGDPVVLYDRFADRWLVSDFAFGFDTNANPAGPFYECVALSKTGDPAGAWYRYAFLISQTKLDDYPKISVWPDGYYMTVNQFDPVSWAWEGVGVVALDRSAMLAGRAASIQYLDSPAPGSDGLLPADLDGTTDPPAGSPAYFVGFDPSRWGRALELWRFHVDWADPAGSTFTGPASIPTASFDPGLCGYSRDCIPQPGTSVGLDSGSYHLMYRLDYRNFGDHQSLVVSDTVDANGANQAGIRWYEVRDPSGRPFVYQQGTYAPDSDGRFNPSAAMDQSGDVAIGYSVSGPATYPSVRYTGRLATDPLGTLPQGEGSLVAGAGSQLSDSNRWGDYSSMTVDPLDDCTFWYTNQYYRATSDSEWSTRIGSFRFPSCGTGPSLSIDDVIAREGQDATFTVSLSPASDQPVTVHYATQTDTAGAADFTGTSGTLTFAPGETQQTISVPVHADAQHEPDETFGVFLSNATGAAIGRSRGTGNILGEHVAGRPDGEIKRAGAPFRGRNIFNLTGTRQTQRVAVRDRRTRTFSIGIRNAGSVASRFRVHGPGSSRWFLLRYLADGRRVTRLVESGRYSVIVPAHRTRFIKLIVRVAPGAPRGRVQSFRVVAASGGARSRMDAVRAKVRVAR